MTEPIGTIALLYPRLMRVMSRLRGTVSESMDLTYNQYKALLSLADRGPCSLNALSRDLDVAPSSASQMMDRLVAMGLADRTPANDDRRQIVLTASLRGETLLEQIREGILARYRALFQRLAVSDQEALAGAIRALVRILDREISESEDT